MRGTILIAGCLLLRSQLRTLGIKFQPLRKQKSKEQSVKQKQTSLQNLLTQLAQRLKDFKPSPTALASSCIKDRELIPVRVPVHKGGRNPQARKMMEILSSTRTTKNFKSYFFDKNPLMENMGDF